MRVGRALGWGVPRASSPPSSSGLCSGGLGLRGPSSPRCWRVSVKRMEPCHGSGGYTQGLNGASRSRTPGSGPRLLSSPNPAAFQKPARGPPRMAKGSRARSTPSERGERRPGPVLATPGRAAACLLARWGRSPAVASVLRKRDKVAGVSPGQPCTCCVSASPRPMRACPGAHVVTGPRSVGGRVCSLAVGALQPLSFWGPLPDGRCAGL